MDILAKTAAETTVKNNTMLRTLAIEIMNGSTEAADNGDFEYMFKLEADEIVFFDVILRMLKKAGYEVAEHDYEFHVTWWSAIADNLIES